MPAVTKLIYGIACQGQTASEADLQATIASLADDKVVHLTLPAIDQQWKNIQSEFEGRHVWIDKLSTQVLNPSFITKSFKTRKCN